MIKGVRQGFPMASFAHMLSMWRWPKDVDAFNRMVYFYGDSDEVILSYSRKGKLKKVISRKREGYKHVDQEDPELLQAYEEQFERGEMSAHEYLTLMSFMSKCTCLRC
eukprot:TRINITY_DN7580_c0_g2_i10.p1 TRINITY_DN7580_c0_g2~~TRINITY_DN7580_c0_g2_i10.p1  ORF type:complete len:108 (-),score=19.94 TRINITY_DN7580_c0_g2_i10:214-537(-)